MTEQKYKFLSTPRRPVEDRRFVAGRGIFIADLDRPNMLHVAPVSYTHLTLPTILHV